MLYIILYRIKDYDDIWKDLRTYSHIWRKILVPGNCVFDLGVSEAIFSSILQTVVLEKPSPVIFMRARKNPIEQKAMQRAHIIDGAAMCDAFALLERRVFNNIPCFTYFWPLFFCLNSFFHAIIFVHNIIWLQLFDSQFLNTETITEVSAAADIDRARYVVKSNRGLSFKTNVAFGPHGSIPHFETINETDIVVTDKEPCIFDSGGQYIEGTTIVSRSSKRCSNDMIFVLKHFHYKLFEWNETKKDDEKNTNEWFKLNDLNKFQCMINSIPVHFGEPTFEQKQMYTNVLRAIIRLSTLVFPENLTPGEIDALARSSVWDSNTDYPQITGHGVGQFLSVKECKLNILKKKWLAIFRSKQMCRHLLLKRESRSISAAYKSFCRNEIYFRICRREMIYSIPGKETLSFS